jgi:DNA-binding LytR/AlgR family response regulator
MGDRIAICDDEPEVQNRLKDNLTTIQRKYGRSFNLSIFSSGDELLQAYHTQTFDLIFLDIEFSGKNGLEVGNYIRNTIGDQQVQIIFISGKTRYAMKLFQLHPLNFLVKPISMSQLEQAMSVYTFLEKREIFLFRYRLHGIIHEKALGDILYFSSNGRKILLFTPNNVIEFYGMLDRISANLKEHGFIRIHKSYLVNYAYINELKYTQLTLLNGKTLPISQSQRSSVRKEYIQLKKEERGHVASDDSFL